jgi:hypothetical protein
MNDVLTRHAGCRPHGGEGRPKIVPGSAGPQVASVLGVFRRPATAEEQAAAERLVTGKLATFPFAGGAHLPRDGVRIVRGPGRRAVELIALTHVRAEPTRAAFDRCQKLIRERVAALADSVSRAVLAEARRQLQAIRREQRPPARSEPVEALATTEAAPDGQSESHNATAPFVAAEFAGFGSMSETSPKSVHLTLIVPDGVATVEAVYPRVAAARPGRPARRFRSTIRRRYTVRDNVVLATSPRPIDAGFPRLTWKAADGRVVRPVSP